MLNPRLNNLVCTTMVYFHFKREELFGRLGQKLARGE
jgi:hypothetical protein